MKVYVFRIQGERSPSCFSDSLDSLCGNEEVVASFEATQEEYDFAVEIWDSCIDASVDPEIYFPRQLTNYKGGCMRCSGN